MWFSPKKHIDKAVADAVKKAASAEALKRDAEEIRERSKRCHELERQALKATLDEDIYELLGPEGDRYFDRDPVYLLKMQEARTNRRWSKLEQKAVPLSGDGDSA